MQGIGRIVLVVTLGLVGVCQAAAQGDVQVRADTARNTASHNNAGDNPKVDTSGNAALGKKIACSLKITSATERIRADERARDDAYHAEYAAREAVFNQWAARASTHRRHRSDAHLRQHGCRRRRFCAYGISVPLAGLDFDVDVDE